ncbi:MAG TPA: hypothetical protein VG815_00715, partial [Chloroflexota bacterium]|nr:hypothetical protein [Chloroflexota bacterium]
MNPLRIAGALLFAGSLLAPVAHAASSGPVAANGYTLTVWATGTTAYWNPDDITSAGRHVYVAFQNNTVKDESAPGSSTVVQFSLAGVPQQAYPVIGHTDGLKFDHATSRLWAVSNEDGNPFLTVIQPVNGSEVVYRLSSVDGGGGFDDAVFTANGAYLSASNPTLNSDGINVYPALEQITLRAGGTAKLVPVFKGNTRVTDRTTGASVRLNLTDPDSLSVDPTSGNIVLDSQGDSEIVFIQPCSHHPGTHCKKG